MNIYFAPLEGITGFVLRNAYESCFPGTIDRYFAPFIAASCRKKLAARDLRDVLPENNTGICLIPQLLANKGEDFISTAQILYQFGYRELNLNLGCPSATVVTKKRGAGLLAEPELLKVFLTECYDWAEGKGVKLSIKTRIGLEEEAEWEKLLSLYEAFPVSELIIHPRLREDYYQGRIREEAFAQAYREITGADAETIMKNREVNDTELPDSMIKTTGKRKQRMLQLCYNGDIVSREQIQKLADAYPELPAVMIGRGFLMRPGFTAGLLRQNGEMPGETAETGGLETEKDVNKDKFWIFHDRIYEGYRAYLQGDKPVLFKMKELWSYLQVGFNEIAGESKPKTDKLMKQLRKCNTCADYDSVIRQLKLLCRQNLK